MFSHKYNKRCFPVNIDLGNSVYLFLSIQKSSSWVFFCLFQYFFLTQRLYIVSFHRDHKPFREELWVCFLFFVLYFSLGSTDHTVNLSVRKQGSPLPGSGLWTWLAGDRGTAQAQNSSQSVSPGQGPIRAPRMRLSQSWRLAGFYGSFWCLSSSSRHSQR